MTLADDMEHLYYLYLISCFAVVIFNLFDYDLIYFMHVSVVCLMSCNVEVNDWFSMTNSHLTCSVLGVFLCAPPIVQQS